MKKLIYLVIHCLATKEGMHFFKEDVLQWHTGPRDKGGRGWKKPGYTDLFYLDGSLVNLIQFDQNEIIENWEISNGARGFNGVSRHIAYVGGLDSRGNPKDTRTVNQMKAMEAYVKYMVLRHSDILICGHCDLPGVTKSCPSFDVGFWLRLIGVEAKNILVKEWGI